MSSLQPLLVPAKAQLAAATLPRYKELLQKLRSNANAVEEPSAAFAQAKERVLLRLQQRRERARLDPQRALRRLRDRMMDANLRLRGVREGQKQRLQRLYLDTVRAGATLDSRPSGSGQAGGGGALDAQQRHALGTDGLLRSAVLAGVGGACKAFLAGAARTRVEGGEIMAAALARAPGQALITVSNHVAALDDPLATAAVVPAEYLLRPAALRWSLCATDRCFRSAALAPFFCAAKVLPVERGAGVDQPGMRVAASRLAAGDWVHVFPEGTRAREPRRMGPMRKGVGWLVAACPTPPLVVPFVTAGMEGVMPKGAALPRTGQEVRVLVGEPVEVADLLEAARAEGWAESRLHVAIAERVGQRLYALKAQLEGVAVEAVAPGGAAAARTFTDDALLPLIEEEMDSLRHSWGDSWRRLGLPSLQEKLQAAAASLRRQQARDDAGAGWKDGARTTVLRLQQTLGVLRGSEAPQQAGPPGLGTSSRSDSSGSSSGSSSGAAARGPVAAALAAARGGGEVQSLVSTLAEYSSARVAHMHHLIKEAPRRQELRGIA